MLKLIAPGKRKNSRYYLVRGRFRGVDIETSTETVDRADAERFRIELERQILNGTIPGPKAQVTWHRAIDLYAAAKNVSPDTQRMLDKLKQGMADKYVQDIVQADLDTAANILQPGHEPETKIRRVYTPAIAVLNYAAANEWRTEKRFKRPKQKQPETRAASDAAANALLAATTGPKYLLLLWLFRHGTRISNALKADWARIDLEAGTYTLFVSKSGQWQTFPLHSQIAQILRAIPASERHGKLFPWNSRQRVYAWLAPLTKSLNVQFTPHMARHWLGKQLDKAGAGQRAIANALGQTSIRSTARYVSSDLETVRALSESVTLGSKSGNK